MPVWWVLLPSYFPTNKTKFRNLSFMLFRSKKPAIFLLFSALLMIAPSAVWSADATKDPKESKPVQIKGDTVEYFQEQNKAVGTGNVRIDYEGVQLTADKITVYTETKKASAEGNVTLTQSGSVYKGDRADYDFAKKTGDVSHLNAEIENVYFAKSRNVARVSEDHFRMSDTSITTCETCCGKEPFYKIVAKQVDYFPGQKVAVKNAIMYIRNVPILFLPYFEQSFVDFDRFPVHLVPGNRDEWGPFLLSKWRYTLVNKPDLKVKGNLEADYRVKKGFGGGADVFYVGDKVGHGVLRTYYAKDQNSPEEVNDDRSRHQWRHQSKLWDSTTLTAEVNKLSDPYVTKDFFYREEYERNVAPDNYVSLITTKPEYTLSILERMRLQDFYPTTERSPEVRFDTHNRAFGDTPFYLRQETQGVNLTKTGVEVDDGFDVVRLDTNETLSYAGRVKDISVTPRVGTRQTYYSDDVTGDRDLHRATFDPGLDVSTHFFKTYNTYIHAMGLDVNQLRHIFTPTASYNYRPNPTTSRTLLQQFDSLDALDKQNFIRLNFENKLQTKYKAGDGELVSREFARVIPFLDYDLHTGRAVNVGLDTEFRPYTWLGIEADTTYDANTRDFDSANFDVFFNKGKWRVAVGQRYVQESSSQTTLDVRLKWNEEWAFRLYDRYEFEEGASKEFEFSVSKAWDCVITDFTYNRREGDTFFVTLRLKAFPSVPFSLSQSYNHPKTTDTSL